MDTIKKDTDNLDRKNITKDYDPFARNNHSESEIQNEERNENENQPEIPPRVPGNLPEAPQNPNPEIQNRPFKPEITQPEPHRESHPDEKPAGSPKDTLSQDDHGEMNRVYPSIIDPDNLEGKNDDYEENWENERSDLDIDNDSNRED